MNGDMRINEQGSFLRSHLDLDESKSLYLNIEDCLFSESPLHEARDLGQWKMVHVKRSSQDTFLLNFDDKHTQISPTLKGLLEKIAVFIASDISLGEIERSPIEAYKKEFEQRLFQKSPLTTDEIKMHYQSISPFYTRTDDPCDSLSALCDLHEIVLALEQASENEIIEPIGKVEGAGANGAYFLRSLSQRILFVFKPENEEAPGLFYGIQQGEGAKREHLAYLLTQSQRSKIPFTAYVVLNGKTGSVQRFVAHTTNLYGYTMGDTQKVETLHLSLTDIQRCLIFDTRFANCDRHLGNLLAKKGEESSSIYMIDHGACMSSSAEDLIKLEYIYLPQLDAEWDQIILDEFLSMTQESLDQEISLMSHHGISREAISWTKKATAIIQHAFLITKECQAKGEIGITPRDLGRLFIREQMEIWQASDIDSQLAFLKEIVAQKQQWAGSPEKSKAKFIRARKAYEGQPQTSPTRVQLLFGQSITDFEESMVWRSIQKT